MTTIREQLKEAMEEIVFHEDISHSDPKWRAEHLERFGENWECGCRYPRPADPGPILFCSMSEALMDHENPYIAMREAGGFLAWTETRVYFPLKYDGGEWIESAPRNPCADILKPMGGG